MSVQQQENTNAVEVAAPGTFIAPRVVRVNLVPAEIHEAQSRRRVQLASVGIVLLGAVVGGLLYAHAASQNSSAKDALATEQTTQTSLQAEKGRLGDVTKVGAQYASALALQQSVTAPRVSFSQYLTDLQLVTPSTAWFSDIQFNEDLSKLTATGGGATAPVLTGPGTTALPGYPAVPVVATMSFTGAGTDIYDVASVLDGLGKLNGAEHGTISTVTVDTSATPVSKAAGLKNNEMFITHFTGSFSFGPAAFDSSRLAALVAQAAKAGS